MKLDVSIWNLAVPLAVLAACGPTVAVEDTGADDPTIDEPPSDDDDPDDYGDDYDGYDDDCWYTQCCDGYCPDPYECFESMDCGPGYLCEAGACLPMLPPPSTCAQQAFFTETLLLETGTYPLTLAFVESSAAPGRELLVGTETTVEIVAADGTTSPVAAMLASQLSAADLDGDGDEDIVALSIGFEDAVLRVLLGDGAGGWTDAPSTMAAGSVFGLGDLDGDGIVDIASGGSDRVTWRRGVGDASFGEEVTIFEGFNNGVVVIAPSNGSVNADLIIPGNSELRYALGASGLSVQPLNPSVPSAVYATASGDYDGDGGIDVSIVGLPSTLHTWRGITSSPDALTPWTPEIAPAYARAADFDGDGLDDVLLASLEGKLALRRGTADGGDPLGCVAYAASGEWISAIAVDDFDGDGRWDIVIASEHRLTLLRLQ